MAYNTFTLRVQDTTPDAVKPTSVTVYVWPLVANTGPRLKRIKDATGKTITGHVKHVASPAEIVAGVVDVVLPDPRDTTLNPTAFGWEVRVETNYFKQESVIFGSAELDLLASGGVLLYGAVAPVDAAAFQATAFAEVIEAAEAAAASAATATQAANEIVSLAITIGIDTDGAPYFDPGHIPIGSAATVQADTDGVPYFVIGA